MFEKKVTDIPGCFELIPCKLDDERGSFVKTYHRSLFELLSLRTDWNEEYYSVSRRGVLRGLHFQLPPHDHAKIVYCTFGEVLDAILDLRIGSPMYGRHLLLSLSADRANMIYIPKGCAHGFYTLSETATLMYKVGTEYAPKADSGVLWNTAGISWPNGTPVLSERDLQLSPMSSFSSPFCFDRTMVHQ